jgi:hypothetical protein
MDVVISIFGGRELNKQFCPSSLLIRGRDIENYWLIISDYRYGHASRSIAIIRKLLNHQEVTIIVCYSFALSFIIESLLSERVSYRNLKTDIGYFLEEDSIFHDKERLLEEYKK